MSEEHLKNLKAIREDYIKVFASEEGKRVMEDMERTGYFKTTTFVPKDVEATMFNEGLRSFVLHIKTIISMDIETLERMAAANQKQ